MTYATFALAIASVRVELEPRSCSPSVFACAIIGLGKRVLAYCLSFCSDLSGYDLQSGQDQAVSSSGRANDHAESPAPGVSPCRCFPPSGSRLSTTDDSSLHFWNSAITVGAKTSNTSCIDPNYKGQLEQ